MTQPTLYVTANGECALYVDGERQPLGDPARTSANRIDLSPAVRALIRLAGVTLIEKVDRRALAQDDGRGPVWREHQTDVERRLGELAHAAEIRAAAERALRDASRLEEESR